MNLDTQVIATIFTGILTAASTMVAVVWSYKKTTERFEEDKKPKLACFLDKNFDPDPDTLGIKTNLSGWQLIVQNTGQVPVFIDSIVMRYIKENKYRRTKNENNYHWSNLLSVEQEQMISALKPFESITIPINNQEFRSIINLCKEKHIKMCSVEVNLSDDTTCVLKLNLSVILHLIQLGRGATIETQV